MVKFDLQVRYGRDGGFSFFATGKYTNCGLRPWVAISILMTSVQRPIPEILKGGLSRPGVNQSIDIQESIAQCKDPAYLQYNGHNTHHCYFRSRGV